MKWYIRESYSEGEWIRATLQVRDEANEAFLVTICKFITYTSKAVSGRGAGERGCSSQKQEQETEDADLGRGCEVASVSAMKGAKP